MSALGLLGAGTILLAMVNIEFVTQSQIIVAGILITVDSIITWMKK